jgi:hypothetical protein
MSLKPFFEWCDGLAIANAIRNSRFIFPIVESIHILALAVLLGTVITFSLRLLGGGLKQRPVEEVYRSLSGMRNYALLTMLITGFLLFTSEAMKCYDSPPFEAKMISLAAAIVFQYTVVRWVAQHSSVDRSVSAIATSFLSLFLWFSVGVAGRAIGFY